MDGKVGVVLPLGRPGAWDADAVESPTVRKLGPHRWVMLYTGYADGVAQIGRATSADGVSWRKRGVTFSPAGDETGTTGPVLLRDHGRWILYYVGLTEAGYEQGHKTIRYATSKRLSGPWDRHGVLVAPDGSGWDAEAVWHVSVVRDGAACFLFFNATGEDGRERIGYATGPSLVGPWTVDPEPLIEPRDGQQIVGDPSVRRQGDQWVMTYYAADGEHAWDSEATTSAATFPRGWSDPEVVLAPSEDYDARYAHKPWIVRDGGRLLHYYTAVSDSGVRQIALAVR